MKHSSVYCKLREVPAIQPIQILENDYIEQSRRLSVTDRLEFLEEYCLLLPESFFLEKQKQYLKDWESV
ncbi:hypothetical protein P3G55_15545 [Leptospira sp. 96542]|nr:hypothetical protein [Leptospira sp. 96542]